MIKHIAHMSPGRYHGSHHESDEPIGKCTTCKRTIIRWSLIEAPLGRDYWRNMIRAGVL
jgi:hypothetical protein